MYPGESTDVSTSIHAWDTALAYLLSDDMQLDVRFGTGFNSAAADYEMGVGFSIRI